MILDIVTIGDSVVDLVIPIPRFPRRDEDSVLGQEVIRQLGGSSNFLLTASRLGLKTGIIDCVGDDEPGGFYQESLASEGIDVSRLLIKRGSPTSKCIVLVTRKGKHAYIGFPGASNNLTFEEVDAEYVKSSRAFYGSGYTLTNDPIREATMKALEIAHDERIPIFFDPSPVALEIREKDIWQAISLSNCILLNKHELHLLTGLSSIDESVKKILESGPDLVVVKRGKEGCTVCNRLGREDVSGFKVKIVDSTGAGDAFNAAFIYGLLKGWILREAAILANAIGAIKVTRLGAGRQVPTKSEVSRFLTSQGVNLRLD